MFQALSAFIIETVTLVRDPPFILEFSATDFSEYENENGVIQLLTVLNTLSVKWEGIQ